MEIFSLTYARIFICLFMYKSFHKLTYDVPIYFNQPNKFQATTCKKKKFRFPLTYYLRVSSDVHTRADPCTKAIDTNIFKISRLVWKFVSYERIVDKLSFTNCKWEGDRHIAGAIIFQMALLTSSQGQFLFLSKTLHFFISRLQLFSERV